MANNDSKKPVHEVRLGRVRGAIWENDTKNGTVHNLTFLDSTRTMTTSGRTPQALDVTTCRFWQRSRTLRTVGSLSKRPWPAPSRTAFQIDDTLVVVAVVGFGIVFQFRFRLPVIIQCCSFNLPMNK